MKDQIEYTDFAKIEFQIGEVLSVEPIPKSTKLLKLQVDFGKGEPTQILSGIAEFVTVEDLLHNKFIFITNLAPRQMMGETSNGMIMAAELEDKAVLIPAPQELPPGANVK